MDTGANAVVLGDETGCSLVSLAPVFNITSANSTLESYATHRRFNTYSLDDVIEYHGNIVVGQSQEAR